MNQLPVLPSHILGKIPNAIVPVVYQEALRALMRCRSIDEGKYYADKADALAAWARIYKHDEASIEARRLKCHAYRRMGQIAEELRPTKYGSPAGLSRTGRSKGAFSLLVESGLTRTQARDVRRVTILPKGVFDTEVAKAPKVERLGRLSIGKLPGGNSRKQCRSDAWRMLFGRGVTAGWDNVLQFVRTQSAYEIGQAISSDEVVSLREKLKPIHEWLDELYASIPTNKP